MCTTPGTCTYAGGGSVGGANHGGLQAGPSSDDVTLPADWALVKTLQGAAIPGQTATYALTVSNAGRAIVAQNFATSQASTVLASEVPASLTSSPLRITDTLPSGVTLTGTPVGSNWQCAVAAGGFSCDYFAATPASAYPLASLASLPVVSATVRFGQAACPGPVTNSATVSAAVAETALSNNTATLISPLDCRALLGIVKTNGVGALVAGATTSYTVTVSNLGPSDANGAMLTDTPQPGLVCTAATCDPATALGGAICPSPLTPALLLSPGVALPTLPANSSLVVVLQCAVLASGLP